MKASGLKALAAIACSITVFGVMVVILDDHDPDFDFNSNRFMAPITSPSLEGFMQSRSENAPAQTGITTAALPADAPINCRSSGSQKCVN